MSVFHSIRRFFDPAPAPGDPLAAERSIMIDHHLTARGITDARVLEAIARVPRERFVPAGARELAYADRALSIDCDQTISQPYIVALMSQELDLTGAEHVLEIGTGSGYQTALLAELAHDVVSVERHADLSQAAGRLLDELGYANIRLVVGDGSRGFADAAPYDRIIVTAAARECPPPLFEQLAEGGILVAPLGPDSDQLLQRIGKQRGKAVAEVLTPCRFVPLVPASGAP